MVLTQHKATTRFVLLWFSITLILLECIPRGQTQSMLEGATCLPLSTSTRVDYPCLNLIDSQGFFKMVHTGSTQRKPAYIFQMTETHSIKTVFVLNYEGNSFPTSKIFETGVSIGFDSDYLLNTSCNDQIFDTGWYECSQPLTGNVISI